MWQAFLEEFEPQPAETPGDSRRHPRHQILDCIMAAPIIKHIQYAMTREVTRRPQYKLGDCHMQPVRPLSRTESVNPARLNSSNECGNPSRVTYIYPCPVAGVRCRCRSRSINHWTLCCWSFPGPLCFSWDGERRDAGERSRSRQPSRAAERSDRSSSLSAPTRASTHSLAYISPRGSVCYMDHPHMHKYTTYMLTSPPVRSAEQQTVVRVLWDLLWFTDRLLPPSVSDPWGRKWWGQSQRGEGPDPPDPDSNHPDSCLKSSPVTDRGHYQTSGGDKCKAPWQASSFRAKWAPARRMYRSWGVYCLDTSLMNVIW